MIKKWLITGDTHGQVEMRLSELADLYKGIIPEETAMIILGDAGINYYLNKTDLKHKRQISAYGIAIYCVRGNHEERPQNINNMIYCYDEEVHGSVAYEIGFPLIRYLLDGQTYNINGYRVLVIGGAYSIDKYYRLQNGWQWFPDEQLTQVEMERITQNVQGQEFDFVFTHTCPLAWEPVDLFLRGIDQSLVEKDMEIWLNELKEKIQWNVWCFGHYHADRIERIGVEMFYTEIEDMDEVFGRWKEYKKTGELNWWLPLSPGFDGVLSKE